jgi:malonate transporter and related proteins
MSDVITSVLPIFLLIILGWLFKRSPLLQDYGWTALERLTYYVLFPCLLASTLAEAEFGDLALEGVAAAIVGAILLVSVLLMATRRFFSTDGPAFTSIYQGSVRMNTYIGLSVAATFYAAAGLAASALAIAIIVPLVNVACVLMLAWFGTATSRGWQGILDAILKNPLIIGAFVGLGLNLTGMGMPPLIGPMATILAAAALPLGLLAVGAALNLNAVKQTFWDCRLLPTNYCGSWALRVSRHPLPFFSMHYQRPRVLISWPASTVAMPNSWRASFPCRHYFQ